MSGLGLKILVFLLLVTGFAGCATAPPSSPASQRLIPMKEANLEMVFEENEGLEVNPQDAGEVRDFYRAGVQKKAVAEKEFRAQNFPGAMKSFQQSCDLLSTILQYIEEDSAQYPLFEGTNILFFPNLLAADNHLKMGKIQKIMGREDAARRNWKQALFFVRKSLYCEHTEWGLTLQSEILSLLPSLPK
jgi:hypothetical protein